MIPLKKQAYRSFAELSNHFAEENVHPRLRGAFNAFIWLWRRIFGVDSAEKIVLQDIQDERDAFWHDDWIFKELFYPEISATFVAKNDYLIDRSYVRRISSVILGAIDFFFEAKSDLLVPEVFSGHAQDMSRYKYFFSRYSRSTINGSRMNHRVIQNGFSDYIVVGVNGQLFKIAVLVNERKVDILTLEHSISCAIQFSDSSSYSPPIGALTAFQSSSSLKLWDSFVKLNERQMEILDEALFFVALDTDVFPESAEERLSKIHIPTHGMRDQRRSMQLVFCGDGSFGITVNPHAGIGGTLSAKFVSELYRRSSLMDSISNSITDTTESSTGCQHIKFNNPLLDKVKLDKLTQELKSRLYKDDEKVSFCLPNIGRTRFRQKGFHPDAAFHAALALAWRKTRGWAPTIGNFINLRSVRHGDIWRYNSTTDELIRFLESPSRKSYLDFENAHIRLIKCNKTGHDAYYQAAMALMRLINEGRVRFSAFVTLVLALSCFVSNFGRRFLNPDLWVSSIPTYNGLESAGRAGSMMSYLAESSSGGHYLIFDEHIFICILNRRDGRWLGKEAEFSHALQQSFEEICGLQ